MVLITLGDFNHNFLWERPMITNCRKRGRTQCLIDVMVVGNLGWDWVGMSNISSQSRKVFGLGLNYMASNKLWLFWACLGLCNGMRGNQMTDSEGK